MRPRGGSQGGAPGRRPGPLPGQGGRKAVARPAGWWPPASVRVRPLWAFGLRGLVEECVHARRCPRARSLVICTHCVCHGHTSGGGTFVFCGGTTPPSPTDDPLHLAPLKKLLFCILAPRESFAEQVSGVKLLDLGRAVGGWWNPGQRSLPEGIWELKLDEPDCWLVLLPEALPFLSALRAPHSRSTLCYSCEFPARKLVYWTF